MHPLESGMGVPAFLAKLWRLVEDSETNNLISWSSDGRSFIIQNQAKFARELLPLNYKHNNMASFIRQLNMYGFHKITSIDNGGLKFDRDEMEFSHPYFQKGHPYLLEHIKRKIANPKQEPEKPGTKSETVARVLSEVKNMRGRQDSLDTRFSAMKQENEALWREVAILRQKHLKQQQIVNKLIQFLVTIVQPQRSGIGKRRGQLMINEAPQTKLKKVNGPVIRELTEELLDDVDSDLDDLNNMTTANVESPGSPASKDPDGAGSSVGSADGLGLDDIDEIDTNAMAIYSGAPIKKENRAGGSGKGNVINVSTQKPALKQEPGKTAAVKVIESKRIPQVSSKSLLIPSANNSNSSNAINCDLMLNLNDQENNAMAGTSTGLLENSTADPTNELFNDTTEPADDLLDDDLFGFGNKNLSNAKAEDLVLTKYNPKHNNDILRLSSADDYTGHLNNVQTDLDSLKDLLSNDSYDLNTSQLLGNQASLPIYNTQSSFDADTITKSLSDEDAILLKLFGNDDIVGYELSPSNLDFFDEDKKVEDQSAAGSELINYQPSPYNNLDLNELLQNVGDVDAI